MTCVRAAPADQRAAPKLPDGGQVLGVPLLVPVILIAVPALRACPRRPLLSRHFTGRCRSSCPSGVNSTTLLRIESQPPAAPAIVTSGTSGDSAGRVD